MGLHSVALTQAGAGRTIPEALEDAGVTGFTLVPVLGGPGRSGMVAVICLIRPERLETRLKAAFAVVERHIGVASDGDTQVLRAERF